MQTITVELFDDTLQKMRQVVPFIRSKEDVVFVADWLIIFGLASAENVLQKNPQMTLADLMRITTQNTDG